MHRLSVRPNLRDSWRVYIAVALLFLTFEAASTQERWTENKRSLEPLTPQDREEGREVVIEYRSMGKTRQYPAFIPAAYFQKGAFEKNFPLVVELGGGGGGFGRPINDIRISTRQEANRRGYFVAVPIADNPRGFNVHVVQGVPPVIRDVQGRFPIDKENVFVVGYSNGANGVYRLLSGIPERFAAAAAVSGSMKTSWAPQILRAPILILHHAGDPIIRSQYSRELARALRNLGGLDGVDFAYREEPGDGHVGMPFMQEEIFDWFDRHKRPRVRDVEAERTWARARYPWLRKAIPLQPKSEGERAITEEILKAFKDGGGRNPRLLYQDAKRYAMQSGETWHRLGLLLYDAKAYRDSMDAFKRTVEALHKNPRDPLVGAAYLWVGRLLDLEKRRREAISWYERARDINNPYEIHNERYGIVGTIGALAAQGIEKPFQEDGLIQDGG